MFNLRTLPCLKRTNISRILLRANEVRDIHEYAKNDRLFFILAGTGTLLLRYKNQERIFELQKNLSFALPAGFFAQITTSTSPIEYLCFELDHSYAQNFQMSEDDVTLSIEDKKDIALYPSLRQKKSFDLLFKMLEEKSETNAPDGTHCYPLIARYQGDLNIFEQLPNDRESSVNLHPIIHEAWYILEGQGEMKLEYKNGEIVEFKLEPGIQFDIPAKTKFSFSNTGNGLRMLVATLPCWTTIPNDQRYVTLYDSKKIMRCKP